MKFNVYPNSKIPIDFLSYDQFGHRYCRHIGWISTPDVGHLKNDAMENEKLVGSGIDYKSYVG